MGTQIKEDTFSRAYLLFFLAICSYFSDDPTLVYTCIVLWYCCFRVVVLPQCLLLKDFVYSCSHRSAIVIPVGVENIPNKHIHSYMLFK